MPAGVYIRSEESKRITSKAMKNHPALLGPRPHRMKEKAGKRAIHNWVGKWKGKPQECEMCGTTNASKYEWANVDHTYKRVLEDYIRMCSPCHGKYDHEKGFRKRLGVYMTVEEFNKLTEIKPTTNA